MNIKSNYSKMNKSDFEKYLKDLKKSNNTISFLDGKYFYVQNFEDSNSILELNKKIIELDYIINSFSTFSKNQIVQSFLLDEIESTNKIENIYSTKHDIFSIINKVSRSNDKKIVSISNSYKLLLESKMIKIESNKDIRNTYNILLKDCIDKNDLPEGEYYRKNQVFITNGIKLIHKGVLGEENINKYMDEFISLYNSNIELITKLILSHFLFEYTHPFYDGNGRLGRFLFSNGLYLNSNSYFSFLISSTFLNQKDKYYKAFKLGNNQYEFGCLNSYFETILEILNSQIDITINNLKNQKDKLNDIKLPFKMAKLEESIYKIIYEGTLFSYCGISNQEIIEQIGVSKRGLIYCLNKFKDNNILEDTKIGKYDYHKLKID